MRHQQLLLFPRPEPAPEPLRHRWHWFPFRDSECQRCFAIWPTGAPVAEMTREECPGPVLDVGYNDYRDCFIIDLGA